MSAHHSSLEHLKPQSQCCCLQLVTEFCHSAADSASWRRCFRKLPSFSWEVLVFTWMCSWCWLGSVPVLGSSGFIPQYHLGIKECNVVLATRRLPISLKKVEKNCSLSIWFTIVLNFADINTCIPPAHFVWAERLKTGLTTSLTFLATKVFCLIWRLWGVSWLYCVLLRPSSSW